MEWEIGAKADILRLRNERVVAVDLGFATGPTTGIAWSSGAKQGDGSPALSTFSDAVGEVARYLGRRGSLIIEAPLSCRFDRFGNPKSRGRFESLKRPSQRTQFRYWYSGAGATTCLAAHFFLQRLAATLRDESTVTLFEGFLTFKTKPEGTRSRASDHRRDAADLLKAFLDPTLANVYQVETDPGESCLSLPRLLGLSHSTGVPAIIEPRKHRS